MTGPWEFAHGRRPLRRWCWACRFFDTGTTV